VKVIIAVKIAKVIIVPQIALEMIVGSIAQGQCAMMGQSVQTWIVRNTIWIGTANLRNWRKSVLTFRVSANHHKTILRRQTTILPKAQI